MPLDPAMVQAIMQAVRSRVTPVGDVIPFPGQTPPGEFTPGTQEWYDQMSPTEWAIRQAIAKQSAVLGRALTPYEMAVVKQQGGKP